MSTEPKRLAIPCCAPRRRERAAWLSLFAGGAASVLVPKCPLCFAGYLAVAGLSASAPWLASARSLAFGVACGAAAWLVGSRIKRARGYNGLGYCSTAPKSGASRK